VGGTRRRAEHWDRVYDTKAPTEVSWYEPTPRVSMQLISKLGVDTEAPVIDVGGGQSHLVDHLLARAFKDLTVLDVSEVALVAGRRRLRGALVEWLNADVLNWRPERTYGLWHDRAVFHFLTDADDRAAYMRTMRAATAPGSAVVIATFAPEGPDSCSGLPVARYSATELAAELGEGFRAVSTLQEQHVTPTMAVQPFTWIAGRLSAPASEHRR
jgi:trans-aconitate methyltransferase